MTVAEPSFDTPEAAAMDSFPPAHCRVVAALTDGDDGVVVLDTGAPGTPYLYRTIVSRSVGRWYEGSSSNSPGWTRTDRDPDDERGTLAAWGEAPADADQVRIAFREELREVPVTGGAWLTAWWRIRCPEDDRPRLVAVHVGGVWRPVEDGLRFWPMPPSDRVAR